VVVKEWNSCPPFLCSVLVTTLAKSNDEAELSRDLSEVEVGQTFFPFLGEVLFTFTCGWGKFIRFGITVNQSQS